MSTELDWSDVRNRLQALMREVAEEIRAYPAPIPACDAQFNRLLELRRLLPEELARLDAAARDPSASVEAFMRASPCAGEIGAGPGSDAARSDAVGQVSDPPGLTP